MNQQTIGLLVGGAIPAVCLGVFSIFQKFSTKAGTGPGWFLVIVGIAVALTGAGTLLLTGERMVPWSAAAWAALCGAVWATGFGLICYALIHYQVPMSKLSPVFNANTLVAVALSLLIFAEWREVNLWRLGAATVLILGGTLLVSRS